MRRIGSIFFSILTMLYIFGVCAFAEGKNPQVSVVLNLFAETQKTYTLNGVSDKTISGDAGYQEIVDVSQTHTKSESAVVTVNDTTKQTISDLTDLEYQFISKDGNYAIQSVKQPSLYVNARYDSSASYPNGTVEKAITVTKKEGTECFTLKDNDQTFHFGFASNYKFQQYAFFFDGSVSVYNRNDSTDAFYLLKRRSDGGTDDDLVYGYEKITDTNMINATDKYLIATIYKDDVYLLRPCANSSWWIEHVAKYDGMKTDVTLTAKSVGSTQVTVGDTTFAVEVKGGLAEATLEDTNAFKEISTTVNRPRTVVYEFGSYDSYTIENAHILGSTLQMNSDPDKYDTVVTYLANTISQEEEGTGVATNMHTARHCLYTFNLIGGTADEYQITSSEYPSIHLGDTISVNHENRFKIIPEIKDGNPTGKFEIQYDNGKNFYFNGWKNFNGTAHNSIPNVTKLFLYTPATSGKGSKELPGYVRATTVESGKQYLIVAYLNNELYMVRPYSWAGDGSRNVHVAKLKGTYVKGQTTLTFTALEAGDATVKLKVGDVEKATCLIHAVESTFISKTGQASNDPISALTISTGMTYQVDVPGDESGRNIVWGSSHPEIVSVNNGVITTHDFDGSQNAVKMVTITAKVTENGSTQTYTLPVTVLKNTYEDYKIADVYIDNLKHTTAYISFASLGVTEYKENVNFMEVKEHQVMYTIRDNKQPLGVNFFAKPEDGYALTAMGATGANGDYLKTEKDKDPNQTEYFTKAGAGLNQRGIYGDNVIANMIAFAQSKDCVGAMGFSKSVGNNTGVYSKLSFTSEKLAEMTKKAYAISCNHGASPDSTIKTLEAGTYAHVGDTVYFKISVTNDVTTSIAYTDAKIKEMAGMNFFTEDPMGKTPNELAGDSTVTTEDRCQIKSLMEAGNQIATKDYFVGYTITDDEVGKVLTNKADFIYNATSQFSRVVLSDTIEIAADVNVIANEIEPEDNDYGTVTVPDITLPDGGTPNVATIRQVYYVRKGIPAELRNFAGTNDVDLIGKVYVTHANSNTDVSEKFEPKQGESAAHTSMMYTANHVGAEDYIVTYYAQPKVREGAEVGKWLVYAVKIVALEDRFLGATTSIGNEIDLNFYVKFATQEDIPSIQQSSGDYTNAGALGAGKEDKRDKYNVPTKEELKSTELSKYCVDFIKGGLTQSQTFDETKNLTMAYGASKLYGYTFQNINAYEMGENVTAALRYNNGDEKAPTLDAREYSIQQYAERMLTKGTAEDGNSNLYSMLVDLLNYGASAQKYAFKETWITSDPSANLVNKKLGEESSDTWFALGGKTGYDHSNYQNMVTSVTNNNFSNDAFSQETDPVFKSVNLILDPGMKLSLQVLLRIDDEDRDDYQLIIDTGKQTLTNLTFNGKPGELNDGKIVVDGNELQRLEKARYYITIEGIPPFFWDDIITITAKAGNESTHQLKYSVYRYGYNMLGNNDSNNELNQLLQSMYNYGKSSKEWFNSDEANENVYKK